MKQFDLVGDDGRCGIVRLGVAVGVVGVVKALVLGVLWRGAVGLLDGDVTEPDKQRLDGFLPGVFRLLGPPPGLPVTLPPPPLALDYRSLYNSGHDVPSMSHSSRQ